jgi:hypothetical protein
MIAPAVESWLWRPAIDPVWIVLGCVTLAILAAAAAWRPSGRRPIAAAGTMLVRWLSIALLALVMFNPLVALPSADRPSRPVVHLLLDSSGSMLTADGPGGRTRWAQVMENVVSGEQLRRIAQDFDLRMWTFDRRADPITADSIHGSGAKLPSGRHSHYDESLTQVILDLPPTEADGAGSQVVVIGDGHDHHLRSLVRIGQMARRRNAVVHAVAVGTPHTPPDLAVVAWAEEPRLMVGERTELRIQLHQTGTAAAAARWVVERDGTRFHEQTLRFDDGPTAAASIPIQHDQPGLFDYSIAVDPFAGETVTANNRQRFQVEVDDKRIRVLLLEGEPYWDTKFLAQALRGDTRVELTQITQVTPQIQRSIVTRAAAEQATAPTTVQQFSAYDVVALGRGVEHLLNGESAAALVEYASQGGSIILARGRPYDPDTPAGQSVGAKLAVIEPATWRKALAGRRRMTLTPQGRSSPSFNFTAVGDSASTVVDRLPPLTSLTPIDRLKPATIVLADTLPAASAATDRPEVPSKHPAITLMPLGQGQVFAVLAEGLWQWSFLPPSQIDDRRHYDQFWRGTVRWLATAGRLRPGEQVALHVNRSSIRAEDPIDFEVALREPAPPGWHPRLTLLDPQGRPTDVPLVAPPGAARRYHAQFTPRTIGTWQATLTASPLAAAPLQRTFNVHDVDIERLQPAAAPYLLAQLAESGGGQFVQLKGPIDLAALLQSQHLSRLVPPRLIPAWPTPWLLAALLLLLGLEWIVRRWLGWL